MNTPYAAQTPQLTLHEIANILWRVGEYEAYRAVMAYIKERDTMLTALETEHDPASQLTPGTPAQACAVPACTD